MTDPKMSKAFVESMDLTGLNFISDYLMENPNVIKELHATNHVVYAWQSKMTVEQIKQLIQMGVDGLIYDGYVYLSNMNSCSPNFSFRQNR